MVARDGGGRGVYRRTLLVLIVAGCLIALLGLGIRSTSDLFLEPMTLAYALGIFLMAGAESAFMPHLSGGVLTGLGVAFTGFAVVLAAAGSAPASADR